MGILFSINLTLRNNKGTSKDTQLLPIFETVLDWDNDFSSCS